MIRFLQKISSKAAQEFEAPAVLPAFR